MTYMNIKGLTAGQKSLLARARARRIWISKTAWRNACSHVARPGWRIT